LLGITRAQEKLRRARRNRDDPFAPRKGTGRARFAIRLNAPLARKKS
jgi:hypothetical protein